MPEKDEAIFRSAEMSLIQLYIPTEVSRSAIYEIGRLGLIQFRDLNSKVSEFQRSFVKELRKVDNVERQFRFFKENLDKQGIEIKPYPYDDKEIAPQSEIDELVENSYLLEERTNQLIDSSNLLYEKQKNLKEFQYTILASENFFDKSHDEVVPSAPGDSPLGSLEYHPTEGGLSSSSFITGVITREKVFVLQQILWRVLRGNLFFHREEITEEFFDPKSRSYVAKDAFIIFAHGRIVCERIRKVCESLDADLYEVNSTPDARSQQLSGIRKELSDITTVVAETESALRSELIAISKDLPRWWSVIAKEKAVYKTMNRSDYDDSRKTLIAEGWIPTDEIQTLNTALKDPEGSQSMLTIVNVLETNRTPPTYHRTNKFTQAFQDICDAYGIASYREVNAGLPTVITFPFLFAIMFGDLGHGFIVAMAAGFLVFNEKKIAAMKRDEIFDMAYSGRYILLLMGIFSMYMGLLYNDIFSKSMTLFKSGWAWPENFKIGEPIIARKTGVYPFGMDWTWHSAENALLFTNSYKMKLSILIGYVHMSYSLCFSFLNYKFFKSGIDIVGNFIPSMIFMQSIFGYLSLCIVYKWSVDWISLNKPAPGLLNMLILMFLAPGKVDDYLYSGQASIQVFLVIVALVCVPWLLLLKPLYLKRQMEQKAEYHQVADSAEEENIASYGDSTSGEVSGHAADEDDEEDDEHSFGDIMIHQIIHTIEFCLNCVSHTASYLRLWALSLAHAQLSTVLWSMTLQLAFGKTGFAGVFMTVMLFALWFVLTLCILVIMEATSAMLHALRLHWVESMSKFFEGEGTQYEPLKFKGLLADVF